jgi:hypothetical protein
MHGRQYCPPLGQLRYAGVSRPSPAHVPQSSYAMCTSRSRRQLGQCGGQDTRRAPSRTLISVTHGPLPMQPVHSPVKVPAYSSAGRRPPALSCLPQPVHHQSGGSIPLRSMMPASG